MFKKKEFKKLTSDYKNHLYTGLQGFLMRMCHKQLENYNFPKNISKVLEIGAGNEPHFKFIKHHFDEYHIAETTKEDIGDYKENNKIKKIIYDGKKLPYDDESFDRIIISHCLEHIYYPEEFIFEMMRKLKTGGILSISLPTDPGLLFRLGRLYLKIFSIKKTYKISSEKFDYMNATEHVNSIFNLHSIIKYNFKNIAKETYIPFRIKSFDLNLFYNIHLIKN